VECVVTFNKKSSKIHKMLSYMLIASSAHCQLCVIRFSVGVLVSLLVELAMRPTGNQQVPGFYGF
jgi:hypothetical protein